MEEDARSPWLTVVVKLDADEVNLKNTQTASKHTYLLNDFFSNNIRVDLDKITVLTLENCALTELPNLHNPNLKQLSLAGNKLHEAPSCLYSNLRSLELLDLSNNFIKNFDIDPVCRRSIAALKLNDNKIHNLPHWILTLRCAKLSELNYSRNFLKSTKAFYELPIRKLELCNTQLRDEDCRFLKNLKSLRTLNISNDKSGLRENRFRELDNLFKRPKWVSLQILNLNNILISILPVELFCVDTLTELCLVNCDLSWMPDDIQHLRRLRCLDISNNSIGSLQGCLCELPDLKIVKAPFNYISFIGDFVNHIEVLDLYCNDLAEFAPDLNRFKFLDLEQNKFDTKKQLNCSDYASKCLTFRKVYNYVRIEGPVEKTANDNISSDEIDDSSDDYSISYEVGEVEFECWDDETQKKDLGNAQNGKNPEVTSSDDEWNGCVSQEKGQRKPCYFDENEDWIFSDVD